ncbi:butyrate kinase [candidate division KSB1 bacterium]|nr:MAG: butyrate kinase [candidate division KSB1 bacterium]
MDEFKILVINPGSTSTKVAVFKNEKALLEENLTHQHEELRQFSRIWDQLEYRQKAVEAFLQRHGLQPLAFQAIVGRGGLFRPLKGGTYRVNAAMLADAEKGLQGEHAANLGCALAWRLAQGNIPAFVVDPVSVDEFESLARYSGHPLLKRKSLSHALNIHTVARWVAEKLTIPYKKSQFVVAHLGGGISIAAVKGGRIIDVNDALSAGPFSPNRTGTLPLQGFISLCFSGKYSEDQIRQMVAKEGGLIAYLGTADAKEIEQRIKSGDHRAEEVSEAMAYQIAKEIGAMATVLKGNLDAIILTGGLARWTRLVNWISERVGFIAPVQVLPGEFEMEAMALGALRVLRGEEIAKDYGK